MFCAVFTCRNVGSRWALEKAKYNLVNEYLLVGVTEELEDFIMILEAALPRFFKGATDLYRTGTNTNHISRITSQPSGSPLKKMFVKYLVSSCAPQYQSTVTLCCFFPFFFFGPGKKSHLRKTTEKKPPTKETISKLQQSNIWKIENEFYEFALEQFQFVRAHAVREKDGELYVLAQSFFYEKIYPKVN